MLDGGLCIDLVMQLARTFISRQAFYSAVLEFSSVSFYIEITVIIYDMLAEFSTL